jgi:hypothetical protein
LLMTTNIDFFKRNWHISCLRCQKLSEWIYFSG